MRKLTHQEAIHMSLVDVVKYQKDTYSCLEETKKQLTTSLEKESQTQSELAQNQKALHEVGEELLAVKVERDNAEMAADIMADDLNKAQSELAALRQRDTVPVKVRFVGDVYEYDRLAEKLSDGSQWTWNGMMVEEAFPVFAAYAVIDLPAGVPSVEELTLLGRNAYQEKLGFAKFDSYKDMSVEAQMGDGAMATAIRDAVLAGMTAPIWANDQIEALARVLCKADCADRDDETGYLSYFDENRSSYIREARAAIGYMRVGPPKTKCLFCDFDGGSLAALKEHSAQCKAHPLWHKPITSPDTLEALAQVLSATHKTKWTQEKGIHNNYDEMARAAIAHLPTRAEGLPTLDQLDRLGWNAYIKDHPAQAKDFDLLSHEARKGLSASTNAILTALRPWLRDPAGWELAMDYGAIAAIIHSAKNMAVSEEWVSTAAQRILDFCRSRIKPVYECDCSAIEKERDLLKVEYESRQIMINNVRAALEGKPFKNTLEGESNVG